MTMMRELLEYTVGIPCPIDKARLAAVQDMAVEIALRRDDIDDVRNQPWRMLRLWVRECVAVGEYEETL